MNYSLEKYKSRSSRHECPKCHDKQSFALYIDENGVLLDKMVGRCNHESSCGYHYTPKQYFANNPQRKSFEWNTIRKETKPLPQPQQVDYIPKEFVSRSISQSSNFVYFLNSLDVNGIDRVCNDYQIGATKNGGIIFWQIDKRNNVRTGKIIQYDKDGHRIKDTNGINWIHSVMKKNNQLKDEFNLCQCLFGEHLLSKYPDKPVGVVEAEKTAIICSLMFPHFVWLATGGKSQLSTEKMKVLTGRDVVMFPDVDGFEEWKQRSKNFIFCKSLKVSDVLEKNATEEQRSKKIDIADWIVADLIEKPKQPTKQLTATELILQDMESRNPYLKELVENLELEIVEEL